MGENRSQLIASSIYAKPYYDQFGDRSERPSFLPEYDHSFLLSLLIPISMSFQLLLIPLATPPLPSALQQGGRDAITKNFVLHEF